MPRITSVESPGCPPLRAITTDILGLVKVVEARARPAGVAKVVETWGEPDASRAILVASLADRAVDPVLAVARKNGVVELLNPLNGDALAVVKASVQEQTGGAVENDPIVALHLFKKHAPDLSTGSIRSIVRHPELPLIASCGLDSYLRIWDTNTRQPLSAVYLKQHLTAVVIDSHFSAEESEATKSKQLEPSLVVEATVRKEKKKKKNILVDGDDEGTRVVDGDVSNAETVRKEKKNKKKMVAEDDEGARMVNPDDGDAETVRKEKKKKKRRVAEDEEGTQMADLDDGDAEMYAPKRIKSGEKSKGSKKKSKKQQVA
uniref:Uncharacterized protein n=1 Tax=Avena sativa TaxID=4498 RepID=A0ACD5V0S1_AVESA